MKKLALQFSLVAALAMFALVATPVRAQQSNNNNDSSSERIQRMERRLNELSERQQQLLRQRGGDQQHGQQPQMGAPQQPMPPGHMAPEHRDQGRKGLKGLISLVILCCIIFNILIAIWIFTDIRRRGTGSGLFVVLALIAGVPTAIIYALVRIGDNKLLEPIVRTP
jgi:hypothetical protein